MHEEVSLWAVYVVEDGRDEHTKNVISLGGGGGGSLSPSCNKMI